MPLDESRDFHPEPRTHTEYLRAIWERQGDLETLVKEEVIPRQDTTNGRVTRLERVVLVAGGAVGASVGVNMIGPLLAPLLALVGIH